MPTAAPLLSPRTPNPRTPAPEYNTGSPNYFGLVVENGRSTVDRSGQASRTNWSPPSSRVRSTAAASPHALPLDANPDFDAFRRQSQRASFHLSQSSISLSNLAAEDALAEKAARPSVARHESHPNIRAQSIPAPQKSFLQEPEARSPKRLLSHDATAASERPRRESPAAFHDDDDDSESSSRNRWNTISYGSPPQRNGHDTHPRVSATISTQLAPGLSHNRAGTLTDRLQHQGKPQMVTAQHVVNLVDSTGDELLILDLRVSTHYARSRITGALNLCVPTTLLKRASHNVQKLAETFKDVSQRARFERWRDARSIVVYDQSSSQLNEASTCQNILKKFASEGWQGSSYIIRGGFEDFSKSFPEHLDKSRVSLATPSTSGLSLRPSTPSVVPVIGGCPMPATKNAANPFFGNIRQNMDLIGGVGQFSIKAPQSLDSVRNAVPSWLTRAADVKDDGRTVADKFLHIEKREQKRMQEALSAHVSFGTPEQEGPSGTAKIQIAGIEKGAKNRYTNIWPFEHSRVKLEDIPDSGCDYVNASYVQTSISQKRFIATQGPLPSTFADFWRMVWQTQARVIVMLTGEREGGQVKAHNYWNEDTYGPMRLNFLAERKVSLEPSRIKRRRAKGQGLNSDGGTEKTQLTDSVATNTMPLLHEEAYVVVRNFTLSHNDRPFERMREITQLQYSSWPDFGVPTHPAHLLGLVEQCASVVRSLSAPEDGANGTARPTIVHCSAGCGRTGTFCAVDTVIDAIKQQARGKGQHHNYSMQNGQSQASTDNDVDLIEQAVEEFRHQRLSMVQSLRQFVLCYEAVLEWAVRDAEQQQAV